MTWARRLHLLRSFMQYCAQFDPETEIVPSGLFGPVHRRLVPHIYSEAEIHAPLAAAAQLPPRAGLRLRPFTYVTAVRDLFETSGVRVIRTPFRAPNCNAHAERFVRSIKEACLDRLIPLGEGHFRRTVAEFVVHYHRERNHQGLGNDLIDDVGDQYPCGRVRRRQRIGGLLSYYHRAA